MFTEVFAVLKNVCAMFSSVNITGINAHEGFDVGKQAGIALAISFTILATFTVTVNVIKRRCVKGNP